MSDTQHTQGLELRAKQYATSEDGDFSQDAYFGYLQGYRDSASEIAAMREALEAICNIALYNNVHSADLRVVLRQARAALGESAK